MTDDLWPPAVSLERLLAGNRRFVSEQLTHGSGYGRDRREQTAEGGQLPLAAIVACADSRVAPALFFDTGIGDLFVCRTAGNGAEPGTVGSLEFAINMLNIPLIAVVGHSGCGAMRAAVEMYRGDDSPGPDQVPTPALRDIVARLMPAVVAARNQPVAPKARSRADSAAWINVQMVCEALTDRSRALADAVQRGAAGVVGLWYELRTGEVEVVRPLADPT